jgi:hypothetical protein
MKGYIDQRSTAWDHRVQEKRAHDRCWAQPNSRLFRYIQGPDPPDNWPHDKIVHALKYRAQDTLVLCC